MAKYTGDDDEIKNLNETDRVNYNYFLLNYDVEENRQITNGVGALKNFMNPMDMVNTFKNPQQTGILLTTIAVMVCILLFILLIFVPWVYFSIRKQEFKKEKIMEYMPIGIGIIFLILVINLMSVTIFKEIKKGYALLPKGTKDQQKS